MEKIRMQRKKIKTGGSESVSPRVRRNGHRHPHLNLHRHLQHLHQQRDLRTANFKSKNCVFFGRAPRQFLFCLFRFSIKPAITKMISGTEPLSNLTWSVRLAWNSWGRKCKLLSEDNIWMPLVARWSPLQSCMLCLCDV